MTSFGLDYSAQFRRNEMKKNLEMEQSAKNVNPRYTDWCSSQLPPDASICTVPPKRPQYMTQKNLMLNQIQHNNQKTQYHNQFQKNVEPILAVQPGPTHHPGGPPEIYRRPPHSDMIQRRNQNTDQNNFYKNNDNSRQPLKTDDFANTINRHKNRFAKCQSMNVDPGIDYSKKSDLSKDSQNMRAISKDRSVDRTEFPLPVPKTPMNYENVSGHDYDQKLSSLNRQRNSSYNNHDNSSNTFTNYYADPLNISLWADQGRNEADTSEEMNFLMTSPNNSDEIVYEFQANNTHSNNNNNNNMSVKPLYYNEINSGYQEQPNYQEPSQTQIPNQISLSQQQIYPQAQNQHHPYVAIVAPDLQSLQALLASNFSGANVQILSPPMNQNDNNRLYVEQNVRGSSIPPNFQTSSNYPGQSPPQRSPTCYELNQPLHTLDYKSNIPPIDYERVRSKIMPKNLTPRPFSFQPEIRFCSAQSLSQYKAVEKEPERKTLRAGKLQHSFTTDSKPQEKVLKQQYVREPKKIDTNAFMNVMNDTGNKFREMNPSSIVKPDLVKPTETELKKQVGLLRRARTTVKQSPEYQPKESNNDSSIVSVAERAKLWSKDKSEANRRMSQGANQLQTSNNFQIHNLDFDSDEIGDENPMSVEDRIQMLKQSTKMQQESAKSNAFTSEKIYQKPEQATYAGETKTASSGNRLDMLRKSFYENKSVSNGPSQPQDHLSRVNKSAYKTKHQQNTDSQASHNLKTTTRPVSRNGGSVTRHDGGHYGSAKPRHLQHTGANSAAHYMRRKTQPITLEDLEQANQYILDGNESDIFDTVSVSCQPEGSDIFNLDDGLSEFG